MSFNFRESYPVLGAGTAVDTSNGPGALTDLPLVQTYELIQINNLAAASVSQTALVMPKTGTSNLPNFGLYRLVYVVATFGTASTSGTLQVEKATSTQAIGAGTNLLQATISLSGTANTPVDSTGSAAPITNLSTRTFAAGDRCNLILAGTLTNLANCSVTLVFQRTS